VVSRISRAKARLPKSGQNVRTFVATWRATSPSRRRTATPPRNESRAGLGAGGLNVASQRVLAKLAMHYLGIEYDQCQYKVTAADWFQATGG